MIDVRNIPLALRETAEAVQPGSPWAAYLAACRELDRLDPALLPPGRRGRVALVSSFTVDPLVPFLRIEAARAGLWIDVHVAPYGQYVQSLLDPASALYDFAPQVTLVMVDSDVLWQTRWSKNPPLASAPVADALIEPLLAGLQVFNRHGTGAVVVNDFALPRRSTEGVNAFRTKDTFAHTVAYANKRLRKALAAQQSAYLFPFADLVAQVGRAAAWNWRGHYRGHLSWSDALMGAAARQYAGYVAAALGQATKCIVLDLDNTLWGGVVGEVGVDGIALGPSYPGREYLDFQRELLDLQRQGIVLAVASKNNPDEALAVLRGHPHQLVREQHLAAHRIDWRDKATNIRELARELNIGLDHMLFLDDSPHEREWVRQQLPELLVPDLPADPSLYADWVASLPTLVVLRQTAEDAQRTRQYQEARAREQFRGEVGTMEDFLRRLGLKVRVEEADEATLGRVAQLLAKTNQFNLTTRRHDEATVRRRAAAGEWRVYTLSVRDAFGDFGLTGVAIAAPSADAWHVDSFLLSCRVIGKSVETALLAAIAADARAAGASALTAEFIDSGRNEPARRFLPSHGFVEGGDGRWRRDLADGGPGWPDYIERESAAGAPR
jgi:FkbH-like protein